MRKYVVLLISMKIFEESQIMALKFAFSDEQVSLNHTGK